MRRPVLFRSTKLICRSRCDRSIDRSEGQVFFPPRCARCNHANAALFMCCRCRFGGVLVVPFLLFYVSAVSRVPIKTHANVHARFQIEPNERMSTNTCAQRMHAHTNNMSDDTRNSQDSGGGGKQRDIPTTIQNTHTTTQLTSLLPTTHYHTALVAFHPSHVRYRSSWSSTGAVT